MRDEVLARATALVGVAVAGECEGALDGLAVDLVVLFLGVLGDDREQIAEEVPLLRSELLRDLVDGGGRVVPALPHARMTAVGLHPVRL